ncbi:hypothetical protein ISCGN_004132 [Ixodes scapularis]
MKPFAKFNQNKLCSTFVHSVHLCNNQFAISGSHADLDSYLGRMTSVTLLPSYSTPHPPSRYQTAGSALWHERRRWVCLCVSASVYGGMCQAALVAPSGTRAVSPLGSRSCT